MEEVNTLVEEVFNEQAELLWKWRQHILELLTKPLVSHNGEAADGQEYQRTLDEQGEADTYLHAYAALLADRRQALTSERTLLAEHEVREKKYRQTKAAKRAAAMQEDEDEEFAEKDHLQLLPEQEILLSELSTARKDILLRLKGRAIKSVSRDLSNCRRSITSKL
jgi:E3 ubiquitin-protein ligase SHPRH